MSIIVPAFNEEKRLPSTLEETLRYVRCGCEVLLSGLHAFIVGMTGLRYKLGRMGNTCLFWHALKSGRLPQSGGLVLVHSRPRQSRGALCRYLQRRRDAQGANFTYEVVVVDDGSSDGTSHQAFKHVRQYGIDTVRVLRLPRNHGKVYYTLISRDAPRGATWDARPTHDDKNSGCLWQMSS